MRAELTIRGLIIGILITLVFTAANVYFGLKAGLNFSTSIPAAVISMAILRDFRWRHCAGERYRPDSRFGRGHAFLDHFRSARFDHDRLLDGVSILDVFWICALGGILGVMYSIPLRRALVTNSDLPYPEGVACAGSVKVGSSGDSEHAARSNMGELVSARFCGSIVAAVFAVVVGTKFSRADVAQTFRFGKKGSVTGYDFSLSFALLAIGHLCGVSVGIAMLIGACIGWGWGVPHYSAITGDLSTEAVKLAATPGAIKFASSAQARSEFRRFGRC